MNLSKGRLVNGKEKFYMAQLDFRFLDWAFGREDKKRKIK